MAKIIIQTNDGQTVATFSDPIGDPKHDDYEAPIVLEHGVPPDHDFMEALEVARDRDNAPPFKHKCGTWCAPDADTCPGCGDGFF